jgi:hypothetical protein
MNPTHHLKLLGQALLVWLGFWICGLPDYYQQYSTIALAVACTVLSAVFGLFAVWLLASVRPQYRMRRALWLAFYYSLPFLLLDWLYCGMYLGLGASFLRSHWYLTVFYVTVWLQFPVTAWLLGHAQRAAQSVPGMHPGASR